MKWYMQVPMWDTVSLSLWPEETRSVTESASNWLGASLGREEVMGQYGSLSLSLSICLSLSHHRSFDSKKNKESCIFITKCCGFLLHHGNTTIGPAVSFTVIFKYAIVATFTQNEQPVPFFYCTLTPSEQKYPSIKKKSMCYIWGLMKVVRLPQWMTLSAHHTQYSLHV